MVQVVEISGVILALGNERFRVLRHQLPIYWTKNARKRMRRVFLEDSTDQDRKRKKQGEETTPRAVLAHYTVLAYLVVSSVLRVCECLAKVGRYIAHWLLVVRLLRALSFPPRIE